MGDRTQLLRCLSKSITSCHSTLYLVYFTALQGKHSPDMLWCNLTVASHMAFDDFSGFSGEGEFASMKSGFHYSASAPGPCLSVYKGKDSERSRVCVRDDKYVCTTGTTCQQHSCIHEDDDWQRPKVSTLVIGVRNSECSWTKDAKGE